MQATEKWTLSQIVSGKKIYIKVLISEQIVSESNEHEKYVAS